MPSTTPDTTAKTASEAPIDDLSFEAALKELERIVGRLESGDATLDESIRLYERGDRLRARCAERLDAAQARIEAIRLDASGNPAGTRPFAAG
jgi:exodeoxyribonuclease VII small subunit